MEGDHRAPAGTVPTSGIVHRASPLGVAATVERLTAAVTGAGATVFAVIDQSGEARRVGLTLRDTVVVVFGNPSAGTPMMEAAPLAALDLPLRIVVWRDDEGSVWMTYLSAAWVADRYRLTPEQVRPVAAADDLASRLSQG